MNQTRDYECHFITLPKSVNHQRFFDLTHGVISLINITDKVELIATEFFQQSCDCLGYLKQHFKSCKSYLVEKYIFF